MTKKVSALVAITLAASALTAPAGVAATTPVTAPNATKASKPYTMTPTGLQSARVGMTMDRAAKSLGWRLRLDRYSGASNPCWLVPVGPAAHGVWVLTTRGRKGPVERFSVMTQMGVRIDARRTPRTAAGIGIGSTRAQVLTAYRGRVKQSAHEYTSGQYLDVAGPRGSGTALRFETDHRGRVVAMHSGKVPQVFYIENCL